MTKLYPQWCHLPMLEWSVRPAMRLSGRAGNQLMVSPLCVATPSLQPWLLHSNHTLHHQHQNISSPCDPFHQQIELISSEGGNCLRLRGNPVNLEWGGEGRGGLTHSSWFRNWSLDLTAQPTPPCRFPCLKQNLLKNCREENFCDWNQKDYLSCDPAQACWPWQIGIYQKIVTYRESLG